MSTLQRDGNVIMVHYCYDLECVVINGINVINVPCVQALEQALLSRDSALSAVMEKGKTLLSLLHSPSIMENMDRLQSDYQELCNAARVRQAYTQPERTKTEAVHFTSLHTLQSL